MEDHSYFDLAIDGINNGSSQKQCAISYGNFSQKDPSYVSIPYTDRKWINADSMYVGGTGSNEQVVVRDETLKSHFLNGDYSKVEFAILTDTVWVAEDFLIQIALVT